MDKKTKESYLAWENWKVLSYMRSTESLIRNMVDSQCLPNVPNFWLMLMSLMSAQCPQNLTNVPNLCLMSPVVSPISAQCPMSAQCPKLKPNVVRSQISDFFQYVCSKILLSKTSSNAVNLAWLISDFMNVWNLANSFATLL